MEIILILYGKDTKPDSSYFLGGVFKGRDTY